MTIDGTNMEGTMNGCCRGYIEECRKILKNNTLLVGEVPIFLLSVGEEHPAIRTRCGYCGNEITKGPEPVVPTLHMNGFFPGESDTVRAEKLNMVYYCIKHLMEKEESR